MKVSDLIEEIGVALSKATAGEWHGDPEPYEEYIWGPNEEMIAQMRGAGAELPAGDNRDLILLLHNRAPEILEALRRLGMAEEEKGMDELGVVAALTVGDLMRVLEGRDVRERVGYSDGYGGVVRATAVAAMTPQHAPECECGCVAVALI